MNKMALYHIINGLWSGIPLCCIKFWHDGNCGTTRAEPDPLAWKAQYVRCDECVRRNRMARIRFNGSICHWLHRKGGPWHVPGMTEAERAQ